MMRLLPAAGIALLLLCEGALLARVLLGEKGRALPAALALPLAALVNALLFFLCTLARVPLSPLPLLGAHGLLLGVLAVVARRTAVLSAPLHAGDAVPLRRWIVPACVLILVCGAAYAVVHALYLPPYQYDSFTNWAVRSKASFLEGRMIFDALPPHDAIRKPNYPILLHALQILGNQGGTWSDSAANLLPLLTSFSLLAAIGLLTARLRGRTAGFLAPSLLVSIPLFAVHLGEGYADHLLAEYGTLALLCLACVLDGRGRRWLLPSAAFVAAACWTKSEGIVFVLLPWVAMLGVCAWRRRELLLTCGGACAVALPWHAFALVSGIRLSPHGAGDLGIGLRMEGVGTALAVLFAGGSFGILWYALGILGVVLGNDVLRGGTLTDRRFLPLLAFGGSSFLLVLAVYLGTPNVEYLLNGQSFDRQLLTPACGLLVAMLLCVVPRNDRRI